MWVSDAFCSPTHNHYPGSGFEEGCTLALLLPDSEAQETATADLASREVAMQPSAAATSATMLLAVVAKGLLAALPSQPRQAHLLPILHMLSSALREESPILILSNYVPHSGSSASIGLHELLCDRAPKCGRDVGAIRFGTSPMLPYCPTSNTAICIWLLWRLRTVWLCSFGRLCEQLLQQPHGEDSWASMLFPASLAQLILAGHWVRRPTMQEGQTFSHDRSIKLPLGTLIASETADGVHPIPPPFAFPLFHFMTLFLDICSQD